jgi:glycerophosphoryl diester phosphodiesterase
VIPARIASFRTLPRPVLFGHRGLRGPVPENTLAAVELAAEQGADGVEVDARPCSSGELVVFHDADLSRATAGRDSRRVAEVPYAELRHLDLGDGQPPPLLSQVLEICHQRRLCLNVELKHDIPDPPSAVAAAARLLRDHDPTHLVAASSFDPRMLARFRLHAPTVPVALLLDRTDRRSRLLAHLPLLGFHAVHVERKLVTAARVRTWHRLGLRVHAWTVNSPDELLELSSLGIDGVITDNPALMRESLAAATERLAW